MSATRGCLGLALGSGSARGLAHIGVLRALEGMGIVPDVLCGCSVGGLVGAAYALEELDRFEAWVRSLERTDVVRLLDVSFSRGGILAGEKMFRIFKGSAEGRTVESLPRPFAVVATDLADGEEVWLRSGSLLSAVRASMGMPGLFAPIRLGGRWLLDGALVNPVPVSLCRALGAERVIAVSLNRSLLAPGTFPEPAAREEESKPREEEGKRGSLLSAEPLAELTALIRNGLHLGTKGTAEGEESAPAPARSLARDWFPADASPGLLDVLAASLNIMQDRITRQRLRQEPPDLLLEPDLHDIGLLEVYRAQEALDEGYRVTEAAREEILSLCS